MPTINVKRAIAVALPMIFLMSLLALALASPAARPSAAPAARAQEQEGGLLFRRSPNCSIGAARGKYAYTFTGSIVGVGPTTAVGVITINGDGTLSTIDTQSINGVIQRQRALTGTYTINDNCTGTATFSSGLTGDFVLADEGREIRIVLSTPGTVVSGQARKL